MNEYEDPQGCCAVPGEFLGIVSQDPNESKSNLVRLDNFWFFFNSCEVYFIDSSKVIQ